MISLSPDRIDVPSLAPEPQRSSLHRQPDVLVALLGFALFVAVVLLKATAMLEPDDFAYRASIVALSHGEILLSNSQYMALQHQLSSGGSGAVLQWHHLSSGAWISEKNPGYPFFAVVFYVLGLIRIGPLLFGALACIGLFAGARAWLGRWAGTYAVWLFCFSGAALVFAWRATMPSFTDASLIAAGFGTLLYVACSSRLSSPRRTVLGLIAFLALESAVFIRYTNIVELAVAIVTLVVLHKTAKLSWKSVLVWLTSVGVFGIGVLAFDQWAYGKATSTGYSSGEISFSLASLWPNLRGMPKQLTTSMPIWILAAIALCWIVLRLGLLARRADETMIRERSVDAAVAMVLAVGWLALWALYLTYTWTAGQFNGSGPRGVTITVHLIRFYLPALGCITLLATWTLTRLRTWLSWPIIGALVIAGVFSFHSMATSGAFGAGGGPGRLFSGGGSSPLQQPVPGGIGSQGPSS